MGRRTHFQEGFSYVELAIVIILTAGVVTFLLNVIPNGVQIFSHGIQSHRLYYLAREKMAELQVLGYWNTGVDTQNPRFPGVAADFAVSWSNQLNADNRNLAPSTRGQIAVTHLNSTWTSFDWFDNLFTIRERFNLTITVTQGGAVGRVSSYLTVMPSQRSLLGILGYLQKALILYAANTGGYPVTLDSLVDGLYIPYIPNDPYTPKETSFLTGKENVVDYTYTVVGGTRTLFANSHVPGDYPSLVLVW
jgi:hypothetical protein